MPFIHDHCTQGKFKQNFWAYSHHFVLTTSSAHRKSILYRVTVTRGGHFQLLWISNLIWIHNRSLFHDLIMLFTSYWSNVRYNQSCWVGMFNDKSCVAFSCRYYSIYSYMHVALSTDKTVAIVLQYHAVLPFFSTIITQLILYVSTVSGAVL